jgi:hypothetical protein
MGYGPGGPPVLEKKMVLRLLRELKRMGYLSQSDIESALK